MCAYDAADTLLCHDDQLEGRRVAFIYYLVPPTWSEEDGGTLDLYSTDGSSIHHAPSSSGPSHHFPSLPAASQQPDEVVQSLLPKWNSFVFFEVSPVSFHRVSEVMSASQTRLSVAGWYHGPPLEYPEVQMNIPGFSPPVPHEVGVVCVNLCTFVEVDVFVLVCAGRGAGGVGKSLLFGCGGGDSNKGAV